MRRPTICDMVPEPATTAPTSTAAVPGAGTGAAPTSSMSGGESRLQRVRRALGSLTSRQPLAKTPRLFAPPLERATRGPDGLAPAVPLRIAKYLEAHGLRSVGLFCLSSGQPKVVERLRISMERTGDADLEGAGCVHSAASLLHLWVRELPEPIITASVARELTRTLQAAGADTGAWRTSARSALQRLPATNQASLSLLLRLLHRYELTQARQAGVGHLHAVSLSSAPAFARLLLLERHPGFEPKLALDLTTALIRDVHYLFESCSLEAIPTQEAVQPPKQKEISESHVTEESVVGEAKPARKRKERHESGNYHSQSHERKVIRSNSEERPQAPEGGRRRDESSIRRVSSHEDFTLAKNQHNISNHHHSHVSHRHHGTSLGPVATGHRSSKTKNFLAELIDPANKQPSLTACQVGGETISGSLLHSGINSSGNYGNDEDNFSEHERRRHSERLCRAGARPRGRSNLPRRRRRHRETSSNLNNTTGRHGVASSSVISAAEAAAVVSVNSTDSNHADTRGSSSKENEGVEDESGSGQPQQLTPVSSSTSTSSEESNPELAEGNKDKHGFLQLLQDEIRERSPSPAASPSTPPLDLTTLHEQVDSSEPLTSQASWSHSRGVEQEQNEPVPSNQALLSPRNSLIWTRHVYLDPSVPPSPPNEHARGRAHGPEAEARLANCNKQLVLFKKKLKLYEEEFERDNGYRPSHLDKFENKEVKKICLELAKLRRELKMLKDEPQSVIQKDTGHLNSRSKNNIELTVAEIEKHLYDKRTQACRPEPLEQLNRQQVIDEKVSVQKALLFLESIHGRPTVKTARDLVRPLYDRYRTLKRMIVRQGPSKMKDSVSELATILEHEAMEFTSSSPPPPAITPTGDDSPEEKTSEDTDNGEAINSAEVYSSVNSASAEPSEKLHALPLAELQAEQRAAREEKRRLRRQLRDFEEEITGRTGKKLQREDRLPLEHTYQAYKQAKARLRLLEALVAKNFNK